MPPQRLAVLLPDDATEEGMHRGNSHSLQSDDNTELTRPPRNHAGPTPPEPPLDPGFAVWWPLGAAIALAAWFPLLLTAWPWWQLAGLVGVLSATFALIGFQRMHAGGEA